MVAESPATSSVLLAICMYWNRRFDYRRISGLGPFASWSRTQRYGRVCTNQRARALLASV